MEHTVETIFNEHFSSVFKATAGDNPATGITMASGAMTLLAMATGELNIEYLNRNERHLMNNPHPHLNCIW